jgi:hypothetical protein
VIDIDPVHLSEREKALRAIYGDPRMAEMLVTIDRPKNVQVKRARNYDIEGPKPEAGPPQKPAPLTRQQRRKLERQAAKSR